MAKPKIGFIGQGWIGKNYADAFDERGYQVVRYGLESEYSQNRDKIADCDFVFVAVPTPTTPEGFDISIVESVLSLVGKGRVAILKSTIPPGSTKYLQEQNPDIILLHSPEFLTEKTAAADARKPDRNILGFADERGFQVCGDVMAILPPAPMEKIVSSDVSEMTKYGGNSWFVMKVLFMNTLFDLCKAKEIDYEKVIECMSGDPRIGKTHLEAEHQGGRGAGGDCFIKDYAQYVQMYCECFSLDDIMGGFLKAGEELNIELLKELILYTIQTQDDIAIPLKRRKKFNVRN